MRKYTTSWRDSPSANFRGLTLIEVLAALAILATLLAGILASKQRALRQSQGAGERLQAVERAEALMQQWWLIGHVPVPATGAVDGHSTWQWRTGIRSSATEATKTLRVQVAELQIVRVDGPRPGDVLASVQFVLPLQPPVQYDKRKSTDDATP